MNESKRKETSDLKQKKSTVNSNLNATSTSNNNSLSYGCVVSLIFDYFEVSPLTTLNYDPEKEKKKFKEMSKLCEDKTKLKSKKMFGSLVKKELNKIDETEENKEENAFTNFFNMLGKNGNNLQANKNNKAGASKNNLFNNENKMNSNMKVVQNFTEKSCLFTKGIFSDQLIFYKFSGIPDIQMNYKNSLYRIIPSGEHESKQQLKRCIKSIMKMTKEEAAKDLNYNYHRDFFFKYKQEILSNHENFLKFLSKRTPINFEDNINLIHIQTGKFLKFKKNPDDLKIYMKLSSQPCKHTIFRIKPGYNYQTEFSTNVFYGLTINIACGDKVTNREMFLANAAYKYNQQHSNFIDVVNEHHDNFMKNSMKPKEKFNNMFQNEDKNNESEINKSINNLYSSSEDEKELIEAKEKKLNNDANVNNLNNQHYASSKKISTSIIREGKHKLFKYLDNPVIADDNSFNKWKFLYYSNNLEEDEKSLNNFDMFWILNCEKDVYIISYDEENIPDSPKLNKERFTVLTTESTMNNAYDSATSKINIYTINAPANNLTINNIASKIADKEEKYPIIKRVQNSNRLQSEQDNLFKRYPTMAQGTSSNNTPQKFQSTNSIGLINNNIISNTVNFFSYDHLNYTHKSKMSVALKQLEVNDINNPLGVFAFEPISREMIKDNSYSINLPPSIGPLNYKSLFRIRNVFTNLIVTIEQSDIDATSSGVLKLVNSSDTKNVEDCLFCVEHVYDKKEKNNSNENGGEKEDLKELNYPNNLIRKSDMVRIRSKKYKSYLAIKTLQNENKVLLILTKNLSDLTIFKLDFLSYEDKLLVNFFDQLNCVLDFLFTFYAKIKIQNNNNNNFVNLNLNNNLMIKTVSTQKSFNNDQVEPNELEDIIQFQKMKTVFEKLKKTLKDYKNKKSTMNHEEAHKVDILKNIKEFNIIEKIVKIILSIWFKINFENENSLERKNDLEYQQNIQDILKNNISEKLGLKIECTNLMLKILKIAYELDNSNLLFIQKYLHHFFKFAGKLNYCTKFLIYILRNNKSLLLKLFSTSNSSNNSVAEIKESIRSLFYENLIYNSENYDSMVIFFDLLNIMLICNDEPFKAFYREILLSLELFVEYFDQRDQQTYLKPNMNLFLLVEFELKDDRIYFKKKFDYEEDEKSLDHDSASLSNTINPEKNLVLLNEDDILVENLNKIETDKESDDILLKQRESQRESSSVKCCDISLVDYKPSEMKLEKQNIIKLLTQNIILFSNIAMNDERFKAYLKNIFKIEIVNQYLAGLIITETGESFSFNLPEEMKCALIRMINYLYLKKRDDKLETLNLCRKITEQDELNNPQKPHKTNLMARRKSIFLDYSSLPEVEKIVKNIEDKLIDHITRKKVLSSSFLLQIVESCHYIIRHVYHKHLNRSLDFSSDKDMIYKFMSLLLIILENFVGMNTYNPRRSKSLTGINFGSVNNSEETRELLLQVLKNEKLSLDRFNINPDDNIVSAISHNSPYLKLYETLKRKFINSLSTVDKLKNKLSDGITRQTSLLNISSITKNNTITEKEKENFVFLPKSYSNTMNNSGANFILNPNFKKDLPNQNSKEIKSEIVKRICKVFIEFLKFIENGYVHEIENNISSLIKEVNESPVENNAKNINEIVNKKIFKFNESNNEIDFMIFLDEFALYHLYNKKELKLINDETLFADKKTNKSSGSKNLRYISKPKPKQEEYRLLNVFLESLQRLENIDMKIGIFEIIYRIYSQKMIFFENISNLVILSHKGDIDKFEELKSYFYTLNLEIGNLYSTSERDEGIVILLNKVNKHLKKCLNVLYDTSKIHLECEELELYTNENHAENDIPIKNINTQRSLNKLRKGRSDYFAIEDFKKMKEIFDVDEAKLKKSESGVMIGYLNNKENLVTNESNKNDKYFFRDFTQARIRFVQYILKNLGLHNTLIKFLTIVKEIITKKISEPNLITNKMKQTVEGTIEALDNLYILLALFVKNNNKHKFIIEEDLETVLFPIYLNRDLSLEVKISLSSFLLEFLKDFKISNLNNSEKFTDMISTFINDINWREEKKLIPYWVEILKVVIKANSIDIDERLIVCLDTIKKTLIIELVNNKISENESVSLREILRILIYLKRINIEDYDNKLKFIFPLIEIMSILDTMKNEDRVSFEVINLTVEYLFSNNHIYKNELANSKQLLRKLENSLSHIYNKYKQETGINMDYLYMSDKPNRDEFYLHLNIFIGVSIPKLHYIITDVSFLEQIRKSIKENLNKIINLSDSLYYSILDHIKNFEESEKIDFIKHKCFLKNVNLTELFLIANRLGNNLPNLMEFFQKNTSEGVIHLYNTERNETYLKTVQEDLIANNHLHTDTSEVDTQLWYEIREILNNPQSIIEHIDGEIHLNHNQNALFFQKINFLVNKEREILVKNLVSFVKRNEESSHSHLINSSFTIDFSKTLSNTNTTTNMNTELHKTKTASLLKENLGGSNYKSSSTYVNQNSIVKVLNTVFSAFLDKHDKIKQQFYFYFSVIIIYMRYNFFTETFEDQPVARNKDIILDSKFLNIIIKFLHNKSVKTTDYSIALIMKFFTVYLKGLDDKKKILYYEFLINNQESENFFKILKNIIQNFKIKLTKDSRDFALGRLKINLKNSLLSMSKTVNFDLTKYENIINPYEEVVTFISFLVENNTHAKLMKDYLRVQYNNAKSHNFVALMAGILESFLPEAKSNKEGRLKSSLNAENNAGETQMNKDSHNNMNKDSQGVSSKFNSEPHKDKRKLIVMYYSMLIKTIECLTKCCQGPSFENQNTLITETRILDFIVCLLFKVTYRIKTGSKKEEYVTNCGLLNLSRKKTSFLKFKLLLLLLSFSEGRKKDDKLYEKILKYVDSFSLSFIMSETVREMMIEKDIEHLNSLIMTDDLYQRFDSITFDDPTVDENKNFIIFEIGTFIYIILNMYYENVNKSKADPFLISIRELKKNLTSKRKIVLKGHVFTHTFTFIKKFYKVHKQYFIALFCCTCVRKKQVRNEEEYERDSGNEKEFFESCYEFFFNYTPNIEVIFYGQIISYYIKLYPMCQYLSREMKDELQDNVDRTNTKSKLNYLFKKLYYYKEALEYSQSLEEFYKKVPIIDLILNQYLFWKDFSFMVTLALNFMIISSFFKSDVINNKYDYSFMYVNDPWNIEATGTVMYVLALNQFIFSVLIFTNYIIKNLPKYTYADKTVSKSNQSNNFKRSMTLLYRLSTDGTFLYHTTYLVFAALGLFLKKYFLFAFHLLEMVRRSNTLTNLLLAIWNPKKQLGVTLSLFILFEYYFTIFMFLFMYDHFPNDNCLRFDQCLFTVYDQTFKNSNGIINYLSEDKYKAEYYLGIRFWFDNLFCIVLIMLILQMIAGIIIDNFSALRENQQLVREDRYNVCYICGLHKNELNKFYGNEEGYAEHIKLDHYYWNYIFLIFNLMRKSPKELSGIDSYIYNNFENQNYSWVPLGICKKKVVGNKQNALQLNK